MVMQMRSVFKPIIDDRGLSVSQVAKEIDYSEDILRQLYEDEMDCYPRDLLAKLCVYFGMPLSDLFTLEGQ
ncbi:helix-turn-helix domain-containing protein [Desulforamulus aquiferis]|uniref:Helix-turn-helix transcriptional regulator n=1 Tax=Desulforamulus aquiferis TaxID=1397668 RepID=A0AAW7ZBK3_9FIRM|nr:helix-turn-helix transcriptional regulator [Desulforamulus aquiferis]MDO7786920.1 helix-turn-helix transcriptional regulator [Desulforamulus aquiferis]